MGYLTISIFFKFTIHVISERILKVVQYLVKLSMCECLGLTFYIFSTSQCTVVNCHSCVF